MPDASPTTLGPEHGGPLEEADVRTVVSLLADVATITGDHAFKKRQLLERLCAVVGAEKWLAALRVESSAEEAPRFVALLHGGFSPEQLAKLSESAAHPSTQEIDAPFADELRRKRTQITLRLEDFDQRGLWQGSPSRELALQAGVGTLMASTRPIVSESESAGEAQDTEEIKSSVVALYRSPGAPCFSDRELRIAHIVLTEVEWLHTEGWPAECHVAIVSDLSPRHLSLLNLLVQGNTRQEVAELMSLSLHTVNSYVKTLFAHFHVSSQTELMRHFLYGNGNDTMGDQEFSNEETWHAAI